MSNSINNYFQHVNLISDALDKSEIESLINALVHLRNSSGRVFFLGVGGSAGNCSHAVNDFRKLCGIECYAPTDNVSELTARINDDGWDGALASWLKVSQLRANDAIFILSVGGGNYEKQVSVNLIKAIDLAKEVGAKVFGIVGRDGGYTKKMGDEVVLIPTVDENLVTPLSESFQAVVWHSIVSNPSIQIRATKW